MRYNKEDYDHIIDIKMGEWLTFSSDIKMLIRMNKAYFSTLDLIFDAPSDISIHRNEIYERIHGEKK